MNISSVLVSPCSERGTHGAAPTDGHSEGGTAAAAAAAAAVPSSGGRALHTIMLEPGRARGGRGHGRSQGESRDESRGGSVVVRKIIGGGTLHVRVAAGHGRSGGAPRRSAPRARACVETTLAQPSASWRSGGPLSQCGSARLGLPRAAASRGRSAPWVAPGSLVRVGLHCVGRALDTGARGCARATSDAKSGRWAGVSHRHTSMAEYEGGCGSGGESRSISAISAAEAKPSTTPRTHAPKHLLG